MNEILYLFKYDTGTNEIKQLAIENYEQGTWANGKKYYKHKIQSATYYCYSTDIDRIRNWRMYSFNGDFERAKAMFMNFIKNKYVQAQLEADRFKEMLDTIWV